MDMRSNKKRETLQELENLGYPYNCFTYLNRFKSSLNKFTNHRSNSGSLDPIDMTLIQSLGALFEAKHITINNMLTSGEYSQELLQAEILSLIYVRNPP